MVHVRALPSRSQLLNLHQQTTPQGLKAPPPEAPFKDPLTPRTGKCVDTGDFPLRLSGSLWLRPRNTVLFQGCCSPPNLSGARGAMLRPCHWGAVLPRPMRMLSREEAAGRAPLLLPSAGGISALQGPWDPPQGVAEGRVKRAQASVSLNSER